MKEITAVIYRIIWKHGSHQQTPKVGSDLEMVAVIFFTMEMPLKTIGKLILCDGRPNTMSEQPTGARLIGE